MRWIEPVALAETSVPSARTFAMYRRRWSKTIVPGLTRPRSTSAPKGMRGSSRFEVRARAAVSAGSTASIRARASLA